MNGASSRGVDDGLGLLSRGELLLRRKEIVRRRFLRIGQTDQRLRHEKRLDDELWPDQYSSTDVSENSEAQNISSIWIAFLEILI